MIRSLVSLSLASALAVACSQTSPPPAAAPATGSAAPGAAAATQPQATTQPPSTQPPPSAARPSAPVERAPAPAPAPAAPPEPPAPKFREVTIPEGTSLSVTVTTAVASDSSKVEDLVQGTLAKPIVVSGTTVVPRGSELTGSVIEATQSARVKGRAAIAFRFDRIIVRSESHEIQTARVRREAASTKGKDAKKIGIGAGVGAIIGGVAGGGSGAAIGAAVGGGAGTGAVLATRGSEVELPAGTTITTQLQKPLTVLVPIKPIE
jgi:hypothetical protein